MPLEPTFRIAVEHDRRGSARLELEGELDIAGVPRLRRLFAAVVEQDAPLLVDLRRLRFVDLAGVRLLRHELPALSADRAADLEVSGATGQVARLLELLGPRRSFALTA